MSFNVKYKNTGSKKSGLQEIKLDVVYTDGNELFRGVGWLGKNRIVYEKVQPFFHFVDSFVGTRVSVRKVPGRQVSAMSLNDFSRKMSIPTAEQVDRHLPTEE